MPPEQDYGDSDTKDPNHSGQAAHEISPEEKNSKDEKKAASEQESLLVGASHDQTRRRFGGRQPLWGMGVTSRMTVISNPLACRLRTAASRPDPGPLT